MGLLWSRIADGGPPGGKPREGFLRGVRAITCLTRSYGGGNEPGSSSSLKGFLRYRSMDS